MSEDVKAKFEENNKIVDKIIKELSDIYNDLKKIVSFL